MKRTDHPGGAQTVPRPEPRAIAVSLIGVMAIASAAIFIRLSEASALATAFHRLLLSSLLMSCWLSIRPRKSALHIPWGYALPAGLALAAHFWLWMRSLDFTTVLASTLFVTTTPIWLGLVAPLIPSEPKLSRAGWMGLSTAVLGACMLAAADRGAATPAARPLLGALLATAGAWAMAVYLSLSRRARQTTELIPYSAATCGIGAAALLLPMIFTQTDFVGYPAQTWLWIAALAVIPQIVGHNSLVWAVRYVGATTVALIVLLEPLGSGALAFLLFDERPTLLHAASATVLIAGLSIVLRSRPQP